MFLLHHCSLNILVEKYHYCYHVINYYWKLYYGFSIRKSSSNKFNYFSVCQKVHVTCNSSLAFPSLCRRVYSLLFVKCCDICARQNNPSAVTATLAWLMTLFGKGRCVVARRIISFADLHSTWVQCACRWRLSTMKYHRVHFFAFLMWQLEQ